MKRGKLIFLVLCVLAAVTCSTTRSLQEGQYLLRSNTVKVNEKSFNEGSLAGYLAQKPNSYLLGLNPLLSIYNWGAGGEGAFSRLFRKLGSEPVVYEPLKVDESITAMQNHLRYMGYYGSRVESDVRLKGRKAYVSYYVTLGKRYQISAIDYEIPSYGSFAEEFAKDLPNTRLKSGQFLSESALEAESERSAQYFRNQGYYGFTKSYYAFEADTLGGDGKVHLTYAIRDYALGDDPSSAQPHRKFKLSDVSIAYPEHLKIRHSVLENLNMLRPGQQYSEKGANNTYTRLSSVTMLTGVNINMDPVSEDQVNCSISLRNSGLQGFKTNLEASANASGLIGISPQITYYHKNLFHGGELLNLGLKGNFQFQPRGNTASSTEISVSSSLRFPKFIGLPNRIFSGPYIPHTDLTLTFNYQHRPDYRRTVIASAFTYNGRLSERLFYQFSPIRANISRILDIDEEFRENFSDNLYMLQMYTDKFDMGISGMLYYTTDASAIPTRPFHYARLSVDVSGNVLAMFNSILPRNADGEHTIWNTPYAQYVRAELTLGKTFRFGRKDKQSLALRFISGAGYGYGNSMYQPLDKMFYCGGSTSMRGWQARTIGPGNDTSLSQMFALPTQMGEMRMEANMEYRFPIFWKFEGAGFVDAGNCWDLYTGSGAADEFDFSTLGESFGLNWGVGLRLNLDFILLRIDAGFRVHDPNLKYGERWIAPNEWISKNNMAVHFGVGYPF